MTIRETSVNRQEDLRCQYSGPSVLLMIFKLSDLEGSVFHIGGPKLPPFSNSCINLTHSCGMYAGTSTLRGRGTDQRRTAALQPGRKSVSRTQPASVLYIPRDRKADRSYRPSQAQSRADATGGPASGRHWHSSYHRSDHKTLGSTERITPRYQPRRATESRR